MNIRNNKKGFSLVEVLLSVAIIGFIITIASGAFIYSQDNNIVAGKRDRAILLADEGLEAVRSIRDNNFADLSTGKHYLEFSSGNWKLTNTANKIGIFDRYVTIQDIANDVKEVTSTVEWTQNNQRSGEISAVTYLTNWQKETEINVGSCDEYCTALGMGYYKGSCKRKERFCRYPNVIESGGNQYCSDNGYCCCYVIRNCREYCQTINYSRGSCKSSTWSCRSPKVLEPGGDKYCWGWWSPYCCCRP